MKPIFRAAAFIALGFTASTLISIAQSANQQSQRFPQFDNDQVKVWRTVVQPDQPLAMHRHEHGRVIVPLVSGAMTMVESDGSKEVHQWDAGKAYWLPAMPPGAMHADVNTGYKPIEVMVIELQKDK